MPEDLEWAKPPDGVPSSHNRSIPLWFRICYYGILICGTLCIIGSLIVAVFFREEIP